MMRLDEITRPGVDAVFQTLSSKGYEKLGEGCYAYVWAKPGANTVLKIFANTDTAYFDFANLAMAHQDNPHFPKFSGKLIRINDQWRAVRMERLTKLPPNGGIYYRTTAEYLAWHDRWVEFRARYPVTEEKITLVLTKLPLMKAALDLLAQRFPRTSFDIHPENIMLRGPLPVLTDPVS